MGPMESGDALANGGEDEIVRRSAKALAACLACDICTGLLIEPLTAAECMHCFCQECITAFVVAGQNTFCPVCQGEGVKTSFGPQPMRDHLRVDFMLTDLLKKVSGQLASVAMSRETRVAQWHALSRVISSRDSTASEPVAKPLKQLPANGAGCVELFISAPADYELEQPYIRLHEDVTVALLTRLLQERVLSVTQDALTLRLRCQGQTLNSNLRLGEVESSLWRPHAPRGQLLHIDMDWQRTEL